MSYTCYLPLFEADEFDDDYCAEYHLLDHLEEAVHLHDSLNDVNQGSLEEYHLSTKLRDEMSTVWIALWPTEDGMDGSPRQLLNFFRSRGVYHLEGLAIFRKSDFVEARDAYSIFRRLNVVDRLGWICKEISEHGLHSWLAFLDQYELVAEDVHREVATRVAAEEEAHANQGEGFAVGSR